jgi:hypothetical protein
VVLRNHGTNTQKDNNYHDRNLKDKKKGRKVKPVKETCLLDLPQETRYRGNNTNWTNNQKKKS